MLRSSLYLMALSQSAVSIEENPPHIMLCSDTNQRHELFQYYFTLDLEH